MKGLWLQDRKMSFRSDLPLPILEADEVLIKVLLAGVCSTDLEMLKGYYDFTGIPGHEFVGQVVDANGHPGLLGKRVISRCYIKTKKIWAVKRQLGDGFVTLNCLYTTIFQLVSQQKSFIMSRLQNLCQLIAEAVMDVKPHACEYINAVYEEKHHLVIKLFGFEICPRGSCHSCKL